MESGELINIFDINRHGSRALGPGLRYVIWTQGCPFSCPGCVTPQSRSIEGGRIAETDSIAADIVAQRRIDGITVSGGEPFLQSASLARLLAKVKALRPELTVVVFTGFRIEQLTSEEALNALSMIDLLVDGPYIEALNDGCGLRGSSNQRLHFLSERLRPYEAQLTEGKRSVELSLSSGIADITGIPLRNLTSEQLSVNNQ